MSSVGIAASKYLVKDSPPKNENVKVTDLTTEPAVIRSPEKRMTFGSISGALTSAFSKNLSAVTKEQNMSAISEPAGQTDSPKARTNPIELSCPENATSALLSAKNPITKAFGSTLV